jgi:hypothetical protein
LAFNITKEFAMSKHMSDSCEQRAREDALRYQAIGTITLSAQDADSHARRIYGDDVLSFKLWYCLAEHRPLGSMMRARIKGDQASN